MGWYGGLMGMGEQGLTTAATGPLDLRGPSEAVILEAVLLEPSTAGCTCRRRGTTNCARAPATDTELRKNGGVIFNELRGDF